MIYTEGQCVFLAEVSSLGINDRKPIGIGVLAETDIDMTDPAFWQGGFDVVDGMLNDLESLEVD